MTVSVQQVGYGEDDAFNNAHGDLDLPDSKWAKMLLAAVDRGLSEAHPIASARVGKMKAEYPGITTEQMAKKLGRRFRNTVTASGSAAGAAAAAPGVGTAVAIAATAPDLFLYMRESAVYVLAMAQIHGVRALDADERRAVVLMVLVGGGLAAGANKAIGQAGPNVAKVIVQKVPAQTLKEINKYLGRNFITKYGTKSGGLVLSKHIPLGLGVVVGGGANAAFATQTIRSARKTFADWSPADAPGSPAAP
jgi:hypothetical protein